MNHLYFCRHGQSVLNVERKFAGHIDTPLTDHGYEQARLAGAHADTLQLDLIVSSPLSRALETARIIAVEANYPLDRIVTNDLFIERSWGPLEGKPFDDYDDPAAESGIESAAELEVRAKAALAYLEKLDAHNILVVSHGSFSGALRSVLSPSDNHAELPNAEIVQLI